MTTTMEMRASDGEIVVAGAAAAAAAATPALSPRRPVWPTASPPRAHSPRDVRPSRAAACASSAAGRRAAAAVCEVRPDAVGRAREK